MRFIKLFCTSDFTFFTSDFKFFGVYRLQGASNQFSHNFLFMGYVFTLSQKEYAPNIGKFTSELLKNTI